MPYFEGKKFSYELGKKTFVMGIINLTPDSFSDGGRFTNIDAAVKQILWMEEQGADIIDIGGESTRPGYTPVDSEIEVSRIIPVIKAVSNKLKIPISVDTSKPEVAELALKAGASIINDVNGLRADGMCEVIAANDAAVIIMHPSSLDYSAGVAQTVHSFFLEAIHKAQDAGIKQNAICLDPGIGFGKNYEQNLQLLKNLELSKIPDYAYLLGVSRKSVIGITLNNPPISERLEASIAVGVLSIAKGVDILRVHDVPETVRAVKMADKLLR
jgi:dihydropteroate synthase